MCPWVGPHAPSFGRQLWGLPSRVEYLSPQGVLLPLVYGTTASPLWLELRGNSVVSSGVCRRCCGGGRAPGVRLARPDVHGHGPGWVWLGVSLLLELAG